MAKASSRASSSPKTTSPSKRTSSSKASAAESARDAHPGECVALVLQGGGALGAYQAGAYCRLIKDGHAPDWVAGVSIGAINAAIIAGNPPERRAPRLRAFWETITADYPFAEQFLAPFDFGLGLGLGFGPGLGWGLGLGEGLELQGRRSFGGASAMASVLRGVPGFFEPRVPPAWLRPRWLGTARSPAELSFYDTSPLRDTLAELIDFDLLNDGDMRLSVGAVDVATGNSVYFDTDEQRIGVEHILASGALPPGFPPVEIEGRWYWDGGIVSNTPLQHVLDNHDERDLLVFQADLFSARGPLPDSMMDVVERRKDIVYSSRTRLNTDASKEIQTLRKTVERLLDKLPAELADDEDAKRARALATKGAMTVIHLIYRTREHELHSKDYEFSRASMDDHWRAGESDADRALAHEEWRRSASANETIRVFDFGKPDVASSKHEKTERKRT